MKAIYFILIFNFSGGFMVSGQTKSWKKWYNKASQTYSFEDYKSSSEYYQEAQLAFLSQNGKKNSKFYARILLGLGRSYLEQGKYLKAEPLLIEAKNISESIYGKGHYKYAGYCNSLAQLYKRQGVYKKAEPLLLESKSIIENKLGKNHPANASSYRSLAVLYEMQGLFDKAEPLYVAAKKIIKKRFLDGHPYYATYCSYLAGLYRLQGRYKEAESLFIEAKRIVENYNGEEHLDYSTICNDLALLYSDQGLYDNAKPLYIKSKNIIERVFGKVHPDFAALCHNLAQLYHAQELFDKAEPLYLEAKDIAEITLGKNHPYYAEYCHDLGLMYHCQGYYDKAEIFYKEASEKFIEQTKINFAHLSEKEKGQYWDTFKDNFDIYVSFVINYSKPELTEWLYNNILSLKGLLFYDTQKIKNRVMQSNNKQLKEIYLELHTNRQYYSRLNQMSVEEKKEKKINEKVIEEYINELEKKLSILSDSLIKEKDNNDCSWKEVQKVLNKDQVVIEIIRIKYFDKTWTDSILYVALILKPDSNTIPEMVVLPNGNKMENEWLKSYKDSLKLRKNTKESFNQFWKPIKDKIGDTKKVYLSADNIYHQINLNTLQNPDSDDYVIDEIELHLLTNSRDLVNDNSRSIINNKKTAFLLGNPEYSLTALTHRELTAPFHEITDYFEYDNKYVTQVSNLPNTQVEVENIEKLLNNEGYEINTFLGQYAIEENIKNMKYPNIVLISTHGFFINSDDQRYEVRKKERVFDTTTVASNRDTQINPFAYEITDSMLKSGLVCAGVNIQEKENTKPYPADDGILTAYEAMSLNLDNTDLVVLSACETGLGDIKTGEGVYGLQRAFKVAGARAILMSLWNANDLVTQELMSLFFEKYLQTKNKAQAFKEAQLEIRAKYPDPRLWGCFVMVGE